MINAFLAGYLGLLISAGATGGLSRLMVEGPELYPSLRTRELDGTPIRHVPGHLVRQNPQHSSDADFIEAIARSGSQGSLDGRGIHAALYALYVGEKELGFYGLEAGSATDADRLEEALRDIWAHNIGLDRARVHRGGLVLVVVWTDGVSAECWDAVNQGVAERLIDP